MSDLDATLNASLLDDGDSPQSPSTRSRCSAACVRKNWAKVIFVVILVALGCFIIVDTFSTKLLFGIIASICNWLERKKGLGVALYVLVVVLVTISWFPVTYFILAAGFAFSDEFGGVVGLLVTISTSFIGVSVGASISFYLGRYLLRRTIRNYIARKKLTFARAIDAAMKKEGLSMSISLRLVPYIPWPLFHYSAGMSGMRYKSFILGSCGSLPWIALCAFLGEGLSSINDAQEGMTGGKITNMVVLVVGIILTVGTTFQVTAYAKRELEKIQLQEQDGIDKGERDGTEDGVEEDEEAGGGAATERLLTETNRNNELRNATSECR